jgi:hypothetical protein
LVVHFLDNLFRLILCVHKGCFGSIGLRAWTTRRCSLGVDGSFSMLPWFQFGVQALILRQSSCIC